MPALLKLLGGFEARSADGRIVSLPTRKAQALLAHLALPAGRPRSRDRLAALLWADRGDKQARHSLTQTLYSIRRSFGESIPAAFVVEGDTITLVPETFEIDVEAFERLSSEGSRDTLTRAAELYQGELLDGLLLREETFTEWLLLERDRLREAALSVFSRLLTHQVDEGAREDAISTAFRLLSFDPLQEHVHRALMQLYVDQGRVKSALRQFRACSDIVRRELGIEPEPETLSLFREIRTRHQEPEDGEVQSLPNVEPTEDEHRQVTVLAANLGTGTREIASGTPDVDGRETKELLSATKACVTRYGGVIYAESTDRIMAVFGAPSAQEDHGIRACRAAAAIADAQSRALGISVCVCLDSGEVIWQPSNDAANLGGNVSGPPVSRAVRIASLNQPMAVIATWATHAIARRAARFEPLPPEEVDGEAVPVFTLSGLRDQEGEPEPWERGSLTEFVGRATELSDLGAALDATALGHGQMVAVVGEPGVGKSRLFHEFLTRLPDGWRAIHCRGVTYGRNIPYLPFKGLLRSYFAIDPRAHPDTIRETLFEAVTDLDPALEGTIPALLSLFEIEAPGSGWAEIEPTRKRRHIIDAIKAVLHREARIQPLAIAVEDLHWLDSESERVLKSLIDGLPAARQLLLVNFRPEYRPEWASRSWVRQVRVDPLPTDSAAEMLDWLLGNDAELEQLKRRLIEHTGGNAFFLEECALTLIADGVLVGQRGQYRLRGQPDTAIVPDTVQAVITGRMDRLGVTEKRVLQTAAVIGNEVPLAVLLETAGLSEDAFYGSLGHLQDEEFLVETRPAPNTEYRFKHALTHDATYESMLPERRCALHARIMETMERLYGDTQPELTESLAFHAARGRVWDKAVGYCRAAGLRATARSANRAAISQLEQALVALEQLPESHERIAQEIDMRFEIRNALFVLGDHWEIPEHLNKAEALARRIGDMRRVGWAKLHLGGYYWQNAEQQKALAECRGALQIAEQTRDFELLAIAHYRSGLAHHGLGEYRLAVECFERCIAVLEREGAAEMFAIGGSPYVFCCSFLAWSLAELGDVAAADGYGARGRQMSQKLDNSYTQAVLTFGLGHALVRQRRFDEARSLLEDGIALYEENELPATLPWVVSLLGYVRVVGEGDERGLELLLRAIDPTARRRSVLYANTYLWLAEAMIHLGRAAEAEEYARTGHEISRVQDERAHYVWSTRLLGEIAAENDPQTASELLREAAQSARDLELGPQLELCQSSLEDLQESSRSVGSRRRRGQKSGSA